MAFVRRDDACVLYPIALRDLFIRLGQSDLFRAKWTSLAHQRKLMAKAIRDVEVTGYEKLLPAVPTLPDPDDQHVVATAMECGADFPASAMKPLDIEAQHPDVFVRHLIDLDKEAVVEVVEQMVSAKQRPPMTFREILDVLHRRGLEESVKILRKP